MQARLEDVLRAKERELKLHQRFIKLKDFCEVQIFPFVDLPLKEHVERLKEIVEQIIPDPLDRTEELFSGEIFTLLGTIYLHDLDKAKSSQWHQGSSLASNLSGYPSGLFLNYEIAKSLDIPEMAIEIINYLTFSELVKKIPIEWEITEDTKRAIVRNTRVIDHIFSFAHLLQDLFVSGIERPVLRRRENPKFMLRSNDASVTIDSREGYITISYDAKSPYEIHMLEKVKACVEERFSAFKEGVNGRLGFDYKEILWNVTTNFNDAREIFERPRFTPYSEAESPPFDRWNEASVILDRVSEQGCAVVVGGLSTGKSTILKSFVVPQLLAISPNVFYSEVWERPVDEMRDVIHRDTSTPPYPDLDITLLYQNFLKESPTFFVLDSCERISRAAPVEKEKLERFIDFCLAQNSVYVIVSGEKETFFDWYSPFQKLPMAAICEVGPVARALLAEVLGEACLESTAEAHVRPIEAELLRAEGDLDGILSAILEGVDDQSAFRAVAAGLFDRREGHLRRYAVDSLAFKTSLPREMVLKYLAVLKEHDLVNESILGDSVYYSLSSRFLEEPLHRVFGLEEFDE
jgi:hypothetical protein